MLKMDTQNTQRSVSAVTAMAIVAFAGLVFDQAHLSAAPHGIVEVGELTPVRMDQLANATLPEIVIEGRRIVQFAQADHAGEDSTQS